MERTPPPLTLIERLKAHWVAQGVKLRPGVPEEGLRNFEMANGVCFPKDFCDYFQAVDGMEEGDMTNDDFTFWSLQAIKPMSEEGWSKDYTDVINPAEYYIFADYCLWCWGYAIRLTGNPLDNSPVFWTGNGPDTAGIVASSFDEFLELYLTNQAKLF